MKKRFKRGDKATVVDFLAFIVGFTLVFGAVLFLAARGPLLRIRREFIFLVFGYSVDFFEKLSEIPGAISAAVLAFFEPSYAREVLAPRWRRENT